MIELWIPITFAAAILQCLRTAWQKRLTRWLSTNGANFVRYVYGAPVAIVMLLGVLQASGAALPGFSPRYLLLCVVGGVSQIVATSLLITAFTLRNFAAGTAYSKSETVQVALLGTVLLAEPLGLAAWIAIVVSLVGVMVLSVPASGTALRDLLLGWTQKAALIGLASGAMFGVSAVAIRAAALSLDSGDFLLRAILTLACINTLQTVIMSAYLAGRESRQLREVIVLWRPAAWVGLLSVLGSACWFMAMTLQNAAYVRALGQVELTLTILVSRFAFREPPTARELAGIALVAGGVVMLLTSR